MLGPHHRHFILHESIPITPLSKITSLNSRLFQNILKSWKLWKMHAKENDSKFYWKTNFWSLRKMRRMKNLEIWNYLTTWILKIIYKRGFGESFSKSKMMEQEVARGPKVAMHKVHHAQIISF